MKHSIRKELSYVIIAIVSSILLLCILANVFFLKGFYLLNRKSEIMETYELLDLASAEKTISTEEFADKMRLVSESSDTSFIVLDEDKNPVLTNAFDVSFITHRINTLIDEDDQAQDRRFSEGFYAQVYKDSNTSKEYMEMFGKLKNNEYYLVRCPVESIEQSVSISNRFLLYVGFMGIVLGISVILVIADRMTRPVLELAEISSQMTDLNFEVKYKSRGKNEIDLLGENINEMSDKLESTISELKSANTILLNDIEKKEKLEEMRKEFISDVSHELKTPIALIQSYAEGIKEDVFDDEESRNYYLDVIIDESERMNNIVKKLMTLSELEFGKSDITIERFDIVVLLRNITDSMDMLFKQNEIDFEFTDRDKSIYVWSDDYKTEEVFTNYLSNAIHYCKYSKKVRVYLEEKDDFVTINVYNSGDRINDDVMEHLWDKFYKADKARSRDYGGSGIGLSIVKAVMESMSMDYGVKNVEDGVVFYFNLPIK